MILSLAVARRQGRFATTTVATAVRAALTTPVVARPSKPVTASAAPAGQHCAEPRSERAAVLTVQGLCAAQCVARHQTSTVRTRPAGSAAGREVNYGAVAVRRATSAAPCAAKVGPVWTRQRVTVARGLALPLAASSAAIPILLHRRLLLSARAGMWHRLLSIWPDLRQSECRDVQRLRLPSRPGPRPLPDDLARRHHWSPCWLLSPGAICCAGQCCGPGMLCCVDPITQVLQCSSNCIP